MTLEYETFTEAGYCSTPALRDSESREWFTSIFLPKGLLPESVAAKAYAVQLIRELGHEPCEYDVAWVKECEEAGIDTSFGDEIDYRKIEEAGWLKPLPDPVVYRAPKTKTVTITKTVSGVECGMDFPENGRSRKELSALFDNMMPGMLSAYIEQKRKGAACP